MPSINCNVDLQLTRVEAIKMTGDVTKHNYLRSIGVAKSLKKILLRSGVEVSCDDALLALPDFYSRFGDDVIFYQSIYICEFLNNIRWGIYEYLLPEYKRSYICLNHEYDGNYKFTIPKSITTDYARTCYWDLMNLIRKKPLMPKFIVSDSFKSEYWAITNALNTTTNTPVTSCFRFNSTQSYFRIRLALCSRSDGPLVRLHLSDFQIWLNPINRIWKTTLKLIHYCSSGSKPNSPLIWFG